MSRRREAPTCAPWQIAWYRPLSMRSLMLAVVVGKGVRPSGIKTVKFWLNGSKVALTVYWEAIADAAIREAC